MKLRNAPIKRFGQKKVPVEGRITLLVMLEKGSQKSTTQVDFTLIQFTLGYNAIYGRTMLHAFQAVISNYHQCLKLPTKKRICCIKGS